MECIKEYIKTFDSTIEVEKVVYKLMQNKDKSKHLRDSMIVEFFDNEYRNSSATDAYFKTANHFECSQRNIQYIVSNRCLL